MGGLFALLSALVISIEHPLINTEIFNGFWAPFPLGSLTDFLLYFLWQDSCLSWHKFGTAHNATQKKVKHLGINKKWKMKTSELYAAYCKELKWWFTVKHIHLQTELNLMPLINSIFIPGHIFQIASIFIPGHVFQIDCIQDVSTP